MRHLTLATAARGCHFPNIAQEHVVSERGHLEGIRYYLVCILFSSDISGLDVRNPGTITESRHSEGAPVCLGACFYIDASYCFFNMLGLLAL